MTKALAWIAAYLKKLLQDLRIRIRENQEWKGRLKEIERQSYREEKQRIARTIGKQKASGKYQSPIIKSIIKLSKEKKGKPVSFETVLGPAPKAMKPKFIPKDDPYFIDLGKI